MLLGTFGAILLGNLLMGKGIYRAGKGREINRAGEEIVRAGYENNKIFRFFWCRTFRKKLKHLLIIKT